MSLGVGVPFRIQIFLLKWSKGGEDEVRRVPPVYSIRLHMGNMNFPLFVWTCTSRDFESFEPLTRRSSHVFLSSDEQNLLSIHFQGAQHTLVKMAADTALPNW